MWEILLSLTNLLQETPTHFTAEGAAVPFTALSPGLQKTNERDYLTDTNLLLLSITHGFPSKGCGRLCRPLSRCQWPAPRCPVAQAAGCRVPLPDPTRAFPREMALRNGSWPCVKAANVTEIKKQLFGKWQDVLCLG